MLQKKTKRKIEREEIKKKPKLEYVLFHKITNFVDGTERLG